MWYGCRENTDPVDDFHAAMSYQTIGAHDTREEARTALLLLVAQEMAECVDDNFCLRRAARIFRVLRNNRDLNSADDGDIQFRIWEVR